MGSFTGLSTRKCSECIYRKWIGDYALYICEISGKVISPHFYCDIPDVVVNNYNESFVKEIMK